MSEKAIAGVVLRGQEGSDQCEVDKAVFHKSLGRNMVQPSMLA